VGRDGPPALGLAPRVPLPLAVALAWTSVETLRSWLEPPFGLGWFRLGHYAHDDLLLSGSVRVGGVEGLSFVLAALAGGLVALVVERRLRPATLVSALVPLGLAVTAGLVVPAPATVDGPRVLLVQPGFTQKRKQFDDPEKNFADSLRLTHESAAAAGPVDLVCWGESMLYIPLLEPEGEEAGRRGARVSSWDEPLDEKWLTNRRNYEEGWVRRRLLGLGRSPSPFPAGASFAAGAEFFDLEGDTLRRKVALVLYDSQGRRQPPAFKRHLVPLGETMFGLERFAFVRELAEKAAGYIPDLQPGERTGILTLDARDGRRFRLSGTVCFDNAYEDPYVDALRQGPVDFHLVASNEAWYEESCEMDQMVAFSRLIALATGRAIARATNSGVSLVLAPDGRELGRVLDSAGKDRSISGWGAWTIPVPEGEAGPTPFVRFFELQQALWILLGAGAAFLPVRKSSSG